MHWLDFSIETTNEKIKSLNRSIKTNRILFYSLLSIMGFIWTSLYFGKSVITEYTFIETICLGSFITNALWVMAEICLYKSDLRFEKEKLAHLEKLTRENNISGAKEQYEASKRFYDTAYETLLREHVKKGEHVMKPLCKDASL